MYQIPGLLKLPKLFHAFSTKADGNMSNSILGKKVDLVTEPALKNEKLKKYIYKDLQIIFE